ncbi:hypothetical protein CROQUDRAFT_668108 [Cronartium quercuum f. sp. fusiforme G11]|uniref:Major facilitator superfamily (MFS) profile domain-containing protein n=1 Tax=Cronartium quercuum f. sp. fusiforme G11 TaxID=708437 RepID=A0A9P6NVV6_9BASI|nr:hypothetical protein CROQUDRAFT_668108 [Cronartium quercuum f. sp. fusiforme G11]
MDVFGRTEGVLLATLLYFIGAILTSSATSVTQYGVARVASALGSQGLQLAQMIIVADTSSLSSRALLTSTISSPWILTTWIGPIIGSGFKDLGSIGYRTIYGLFGLLVPLCSLWLSGVLFWEWKSIRKSKDHEEHHLNQHQKGNVIQKGDWKLKNSLELWNQTKHQLDLNGIFLLTIGCGLILLPLTLTSTGPTPRSYEFLFIGFIILIGFWKYESKIASSPIIPIRLLKQRTIVVGSGVCFWHFMCQYVYESYFTSFLQVVRLSSARDAQYIQESYMFTACISALICGILVRWSRRYKIWVIVGIILHSIGAMLMIRTRKLNNPLPELIISQIIAGFGGGFTTLGAQLGVQAVVSHQDVGIATAVFLTVTQIGGAVGSSLAGGIWSSKLTLELLNKGIKKNEVKKIVGDLSYALSFPLNSFTRNSINFAYVEVQRELNWLALFCLLPCLICGFLMENVDLSEPNQRDLDTDDSIQDERSPLIIHHSPLRAETSNSRSSL